MAAISVLTTAHMYMGPKLRSLFDEEKPALLQQIDAELEKVGIFLMKKKKKKIFFCVTR